MMGDWGRAGKGGQTLEKQSFVEHSINDQRHLFLPSGAGLSRRVLLGLHIPNLPSPSWSTDLWYAAAKPRTKLGCEAPCE